MILALAGGVGGARLAEGLAQCLPPALLCVAVNIGDDFEHLGLTICPDLDTVMYTLAGRNDAAQGWGLAGESWRTLRALEALGGPTWFRLGDLDIATHLQRSQRLRDGATLSQATAELCAAFGVRHRILPVSDQPIRTRVHTISGELAFQEYFVRQRCEPRLLGLHFAGAEAAAMAPGLAQTLASPALEAIVVCPSNPWLSIQPMLAIPGLESALRARRVPVVAVSPIVAGQAVKGPLAKMMAESGEAVSALGVARFYSGLVDVFVIDEADVALRPAIEALDLRVVVAPTLMRDGASRQALAAIVLKAWAVPT